jgi:hypothetical protein
VRCLSSCRALEVVAVIPQFLLTVDLQAAHEQLQNKLFLSNSVKRLSHHKNKPAVITTIH